MDQEFQTSFIPKKPLAETRVPVAKPVNVISFIATIIFFAALVGAGGVYFYQIILTKQVAASGVQLAQAEASFEPSLIADLLSVDRRINDAKDILKNHIATSPIFQALQTMTLKSVQFTKFSYTYDSAGKKVNVKMSGIAKDYNAIAAQSDTLGKNKYINNPVFSNLNLDAKGHVSFDLFFSVDPTFVSYEDILNRNSGSQSGASDGSGSTDNNVTTQ